MILPKSAMINDNQGFTLIEFLVATVILMVGLLGMLQGVNLAMDKNLGNLLRNEAITLADDRMMQKRVKSFDSLSTNTLNTSLQRSARGVLKNYSVNEIVTLATTNSKGIVVNVSWRYKQIKNSHSLSSFVSRTPQ